MFGSFLVSGKNNWKNKNFNAKSGFDKINFVFYGKSKINDHTQFDQMIKL